MADCTGGTVGGGDGSLMQPFVPPPYTGKPCVFCGRNRVKPHYDEYDNLRYYECEKCESIWNAQARYYWEDAIAQAVAEERERCCADLCGLCRDRVPLEVDHPMGVCHRLDSGKSTNCKAAAIRARGEG